MDRGWFPAGAVPWCDPFKRHPGTTATRTILAVAWPSARRHGPHDAVDDLWTSACAVRLVAISRESWIRSRWGLSPIRRRIVSLSLASATPYECEIEAPDIRAATRL